MSKPSLYGARPQGSSNTASSAFPSLYPPTGLPERSFTSVRPAASSVFPSELRHTAR